MLAVCLGALAWLLLPGPAVAEKGKVTVEKVEYGGWKNNLRISNGDAELIVTLDVGPRVISYRLANGKNVFKNFADQMGKSGESDWVPRGGHRLWTAPEDLTRTYSPDNSPIEYKEVPGGARVIQPTDKYGIHKEMEVRLEPSGSRVTVLHQILNAGQEETELAVWALTIMAPGGVEIIPLPPHHPHPGPPQNARSPKDFAADLSMTFWPYFDFKDPRWNFGTNYVTLRQDASKGPTKIGVSHRVGWVGYLNEGTLFIKRFGYQEGKHYPDNGCNFETFTNQDMLEMESLGPLGKLAPGKAVQHTEHWQLVGNVEDFQDEAGIDKNVRPKVAAK
jgi:hypothetical protein